LHLMSNIYFLKYYVMLQYQGRCHGNIMLWYNTNVYVS